MEGHEDAPESSSQSQNVVVIEKRLGTRRERRKTRIFVTTTASVTVCSLQVHGFDNRSQASL